MSYNVPNYMEQGSTNLVIGGKQTVSGKIVLAAGSKLQVPVERVNNAVSATAGSTGFEALAQAGLSRLSATGSTATASVGFRLPHPVAGLRKSIIAEHCSATHICLVETTALSVMFGSTLSTGKNYHQLSFNAAYEAVELVGGSSKYWFVQSNVGAVALSTAFTT